MIILKRNYFKLNYFIRIFYTSSLAFIFTINVFASDETDALRSILNRIRETYPAYIENMYRSQVFNYLSFKMQDFLALTSQLSNQAQNSAMVLQQLSDEEAQVYAQASNATPHALSQMATHYGDLITRMDHESRILQKVANDYELLKQFWAHRCAPEKIESMAHYFRPSDLYTPSRLDLKPVGTPFTVGIHVSPSYSNGIANPSFMSEGDSIAIVIGTAAGSCFGTVGGIIGGLAVSLVVSIKNAIIFFNERNEQDQLIQNIISFQHGQIQDLQSRSQGIVETTCNEAFPRIDTNLSANSNESAIQQDAITSTLEVAAQTLQSNSRSAQAITQQAHRHMDNLRERFSVQLTTFMVTQSEQIRQTFLRNLEELDESLNLSDDEIRRSLNTAITEVGALRDAAGPDNKSQAEQDLWNTYIRTEALAAPRQPLSNFSLWSTFRDYVTREILQEVQP